MNIFIIITIIYNGYIPLHTEFKTPPFFWSSLFGGQNHFGAELHSFSFAHSTICQTSLKL